jgi:vacuolar-type H+-ATPase subunit H
MNPTAGGFRAEDKFEEAKDKGREAWQKATEAGGQAVDAAKQAGNDAMSKIKEAGSATLDKARETVASAGHIAAETATALGQKADDMTGAAGHQIRGLGESIAESLPREGMTGYASQAVAGSVKGAGEYVEERKLSGMARDLEEVVSNHPIPTALIAFGLGICIGRALKD